MTKQPNVVLINCDDLGYGDLGCSGSTRNQTPALDRLAAEGVQFTSFYTASPVCSPARGRFVYTFDFGDDWHHLCTVGPERVDPTEVYGITPTRLMPYWGWGTLPDQYGRRWADDNDEAPIPPDPQGGDLPAFFPPWRWRAEQP